MKKFCIISFIITRIFYFIFIQLIFNTKFIRKRDYSQDILANSDIKNISFAEKILLNWLKYFLSYDGQHFEYISENGYLLDHLFCFYPFFPYCARIFVPIFRLFNFKNPHSPFIFSGLLFSNILGLLNTILLANIIYKITNSKVKGKISALLFLINPGTIFYMAYYSENLYFFLSLLLVKELMNDNYNLFYYIKLCLIIMGLLMTRSNGIILLSFFVIPIFKKLFEDINKNQISFTFEFLGNFKLFLDLILKNFIFIFLHVLLCFYGFLIFYWMVNLRPKNIICTASKKLINYNDPNFPDYWNFCNNLNSPIKNIYNYLQNKYWSVGFFSQYYLSNLDKILFSLPMNIIGGYLIYRSFRIFNFKALIKLNIIEFFFHDKNIKKENLFVEAFILGGLINFCVLFFTIITIAYISINNRLYTGHILLYYWLSEDILKYLKGENKTGFLIISTFFIVSLLYVVTNIGSYNGV